MKYRKRVTKMELEEFLKTFGIYGIDGELNTCVEPPLVNYHDKRLMVDGMFCPKSVVARAIVMDGTEYYGFKKHEYFIDQEGPDSDIPDWERFNLPAKRRLEEVEPFNFQAPVLAGTTFDL